MGLDTSHNCWHGSYHWFHFWRNKLAEAAGYMIREVKWSETYKSESPLIDYGHLENNVMGKWDKTPRDPLLVLLVHSDCEGYIYCNQQLPLAKRLKELLPLLKDDDKEITQKFINGLLEAYDNSEPVEFH